VILIPVILPLILKSQINMAYNYKLYWSDEAIRNLDLTLDYLEKEWTQKEINKFKIKLSKQLNLIIQNPRLFPKSAINPRLRRAVLSKQTTIFYELSGQQINLVYLFNNRQNINKIK
jgi:plasmid stabilization system protein ParE